MVWCRCRVAGRWSTASDLQLNYGMGELPFVATAPWGAGSAVAASVGMAAMALEAGLCDYVVAWHVMDWGTAATTPGSFHDDQPNKHDFETPFGWFGQPAHLAMCARRHMSVYGTKPEHLGAIAVTQRAHAGLNGNTVMTEPITMDDYFASRWIAEPFRLLDCCIINDGAAAYVITTPERARDLKGTPGVVPRGGSVAVVIAVCIGRSSPTSPTPRRCTPRRGRTRWPGWVRRTSTSCRRTTVSAGWCCRASRTTGSARRARAATSWTAARRITLGGELPVNTHGGMLSQSYLQGMNHLCEAVRQLRGDGGRAQIEGAEVGVVGGYAGTTYGTLVLGKA